MLDLIIFVIQSVGIALGDLMSIPVPMGDGSYLNLGIFFIFFILIFLFIKFIKILSNQSVTTVKSNGGKR